MTTPRTTDAERDRKLLDELQGERCACGRPKSAGLSFCGRCYYQLPKSARSALYIRIGHGYAAAYARALRLLGLDEQGEQSP